jgi:hypothetical protein
MAIPRAKANVGRDTPMGPKMNSLPKKDKGVAPDVTAGGNSNDAGATDKELSSAASSLYSRAVNNSGGGGGDDALKSR